MKYCYEYLSMDVIEGVSISWNGLDISLTS